MDKYDNSENEEKIGNAFALLVYLKNMTFYGIIGAVAGYVIGRNWKSSLFGACLLIIIRIVVIRLIWKAIQILVDAAGRSK